MYTLLKETVTDAAIYDIIFNNSSPFINCITKILKSRLDEDSELDLTMPMYNFTEYSDSYSNGNIYVYGNITEMNQLLIMMFLLL